LNLHLSPQEQQTVQRRYTQNAKAYEEFLLGRALLVHKDQPQALEASRKHFQAALDLDPNYALALAGLSSVEGYYYRDVKAEPAYLVRAEQLAKQSLAIDPQLAEGHVAMGRVLGIRFRYAEAASESRLATQEKPDHALAWDLLSWALAYKTPPEPIEAEKAARVAIRLNPGLVYAYYHLGRALYEQGHFPEAMAAFDRCEEVAGTSAGADLGRAQALGAQRHYAEALARMEKRSKQTEVDNYWLSVFYAGSGEREKSLVALQKAFDLGFRDAAAINAEPAFAPLRDDARLREILLHMQASPQNH
jgi:tetratricopeptide (TPR) repeat protein